MTATATELYTGNYGIMDTDGHIIEPADLWTGELMESKYKGRGLQFGRTAEGLHLQLDGQFLRGTDLKSVQAIMGMGRSLAEMEDLKMEWPGDADQAGYDPVARLARADEEGLKYTAIFTSLGLLWNTHIQDIELAHAMGRAYNRWVIDFCSGSNGRLVPVAHAFLGDPQVAAADLKTAVEAGAKGAMIVTFNIRKLPLGDPEWDPFYATAQDLNVPICIHVSGETREYRPFSRIQPKILHDGGQFLMSVLGGRVAMEIALVDMFQYGLFERFPKLRVGFFEGGAGWVSSLLDKMEAVFDTQVGERGVKRTLRPREVFAKQCFVSGDPDEKGWAKTIEDFGPHQFGWASDFPHPDHPGNYMEHLAHLAASLHTPESRNGLMGDAAVRFFGLA
jgi:predicted TIM-barrel fold metal-dependent hydrolase